MKFNFEFSLSVLNDLGPGLYRSFATVIAEAISNSWDADAEFVRIEIKKDSLVIWDNGVGMDVDGLKNKFLKIGYRRRIDPQVSENDVQVSEGKKRYVLGRKGIGKLAYLSIADEVIVITKKEENKVPVSVVMNNQKIAQDVKRGVDAQESTLPELSDAELKKYGRIKESGMQIVFRGLKKHLRRHNIRAILATQFHFSHVLGVDDKFEIFVKGDEDKEYDKIGIKDIASIYQDGQFAWFFNKESKKRFDADMKEAKIKPKFLKTRMIHLSDKEKSNKVAKLDGYILSVEKLPSLYVHTGQKDLKASVALFANGRMRESNFVSKISRSQLPENYLFGQIHVDSMDKGENDPFTSGRDSVKEDDELYIEVQALVDKALSQIVDEWRKWRKEWKKSQKPGDEKAIQVRTGKKVTGLVMQMIKDREYNLPDPLVEKIRAMAEQNVPSYINCFIVENIMRHYIAENDISYPQLLASAKKRQESEKQEQDDSGLEFDIRECPFGEEHALLNYLHANELASIIDNHMGLKSPKTIGDNVEYQRLSRNGLMHTALLTMGGKSKGNIGWISIIHKISKWLKSKS